MTMFFEVGVEVCLADVTVVAENVAARWRSWSL